MEWLMLGVENVRPREVKFQFPSRRPQRDRVSRGGKATQLGGKWWFAWKGTHFCAPSTGLPVCFLVESILLVVILTGARPPPALDVNGAVGVVLPDAPLVEAVAVEAGIRVSGLGRTKNKEG